MKAKPKKRSALKDYYGPGSAAYAKTKPSTKCRACGWDHPKGGDCKGDRYGFAPKAVPVPPAKPRDVLLSPDEIAEVLIQSQETIANALDAHSFMVALYVNGHVDTVRRATVLLHEASRAVRACHGVKDPPIDLRFLGAVVHAVVKKVKAHAPDKMSARAKVKLFRDATDYTIQVVKDSWPLPHPVSPAELGEAIAEKYLGE